VRDFETKKLYQMACRRNKSSGAIELGEPKEVRQAFLPVGDAVEKAEALPEVEEVEVQQKRDELWKELL
jgi:hypothetical protein